MNTDPDASADEIIHAVDSTISAVRTANYDFSFNELADMHSDGELIIDPEFQRMFRWTPGAQSRFIESLVLELPVPPIFLLEREDRIYELIDGLQRMSSYLHFRGQLRKDEALLSPLVLEDCDIIPQLNGKTYEDLPRALEIKLKRSYIRAEVLRKESDNKLRYYMFKRLNTGGELLSEQEVRNATIRLLSNEFNDLIIRLSRNEDFKYCIETVSGNAVERKFDQELVLRYFALKNDGQAYRHDVSDFLTDYMEKVSDESNTAWSFDYTAEEEVFTRTFALLRRAARRREGTIGGRIFGSVTSGSTKPRGQFSVYHYEGITLGAQDIAARIGLDDAARVEEVAQIIESGKADEGFLESTGSGKNDAVPFRNRVKYFRDRFDSIT